MAASKRVLLFAVLTVAIMSVSTGSILVRVAEAHPFVKCVYRVSFATLVFLPVSLIFYREDYRRLTGRDLAITLLSGAFLAFHFAVWMTSLDYTSVASSLILVDTVPIWTALINLALGRERLSRLMGLCIVMSVVGACILGYGDMSFGKRELFGDFLALLGGIAASVYIICGGEVRRKLSIASYATLCYGSCAVIMWIVVLAMGLKITGFSAATWRALAGMALLAQVLGHSGYNWALGYCSTCHISILLLGEPLGGAILAWLFFGEYPKGVGLLGFAFLVAAILLSSRDEKRA
ncbi:MAG: DMT family transporter [Synergistaceae bacterium]|nr:DMT family transporter [Synergistaceae bacterium]